MDKNLRHNRPNKKEKPIKIWENELRTLKERYEHREPRIEN